MTVHIAGSLNYHNETILTPILEEFTRRHIDFFWTELQPTEGANVHVENLTEQTMKYWESFSTLLPMLKKNDKVFILDMWNPMIFQLKFWSARKGLDLQFYTIHHGSSHLSGDFSAGEEFSWVEKFEDAWINSYDKIFFGSNNARDLVVPSAINPAAMVTTYLPIDYIAKTKTAMLGKNWRYTERGDTDVIMPLRLDDDKGANEFFEVVANNPDMKFHALDFHSNVEIPSLRNLYIHEAMERDALFNLMQRCTYAISCAKQETFGYGMIEAVMNGCQPLLQKSDENCYAEIYSDSCLFEDHNKVIFEKIPSESVFRPEWIIREPAAVKIVGEILA